MSKKKEIILSLLGIIGLIAVTVGVTYAFFNYTKTGSTENVVTSGTITFLYTEVSGVGKGISINDAYPIPDSQGKIQTGEGKVFDFKVTSNTSSSYAIPYEVTARKKIVDNLLDEDAVKLYLTKVTGASEEEVLLSKYSDLTQTDRVDSNKYVEKTIYNGKVPANSTNYEQAFRLRMWIAEDTDFSPNEDGTYPYNNKTFTVTVNVYANAKVVTEEDLKAEITSLKVNDTEVTEVTGKDYNYEITLDEGTTQASINVETVSEYATVKIEKLDSLASSNNIKRLGVKKTLDLVNGNNYFKITVTSENKEVENEYKLKVKVGKEIINTLSSLNISNCTLSPTFISETTSYTCSVDYDVDSLEVTTETASEYANVKVEGNNGLVTGNNTVTITVTAEDNTTKTYTVTVTRKIYTEALLNGADPILSNNLVPIKISNTGVVTKASLSDEWYDYETKQWANAVVLKTNTTYANGATIPESNIESYFVWIPKYSYKLWDLGNYSSLTSISSKEQAINIKFGLTNTSDSNTGECTTPKTAGASGNCSVGEYMTHPAFLAFDTNGLWVGKFETGYNGATSTTAAEINSSDSSKIIIKPNVYSWRGSTVGNMFKASYDYLRNDESHMMKNTEWGAVVYLTNSLYGTCEEVDGEIKCGEVRINNNSAYITGYAGTEQPTKSYNNGISIEGNRFESTAVKTDNAYTVNYLNNNSVVASTASNYTGIYDISGGTWEYVMGYTTGSLIGVGGSSGITNLHSDFFTNSSWEKYFDKYSSTADENYNNRILGDATGEMGPFGNSVDSGNSTTSKSSWYRDNAHFVISSHPWFNRGGSWNDGTSAGAFAFSNRTGGSITNISFRVVLAPQGGSN